LKEMGKGEQGIWGKLKEKSALLGSALVEIPPVAERVLRRLDRGELSLKLPLASLEEVMEENTRALRVQTWGILLGIDVVVAAYLFVHQYMEMSRYCLYLVLIPSYFMYKNSRAPRRRNFKAPPQHMLRQRGQGEKLP
jgi:hypothetical protein